MPILQCTHSLECALLYLSLLEENQVYGEDLDDTMERIHNLLNTIQYNIVEWHYYFPEGNTSPIRDYKFKDHSILIVSIENAAIRLESGL